MCLAPPFIATISIPKCQQQLGSLTKTLPSDPQPPNVRKLTLPVERGLGLHRNSGADNMTSLCMCVFNSLTLRSRLVAASISMYRCAIARLHMAKCPDVNEHCRQLRFCLRQKHCTNRLRAHVLRQKRGSLLLQTCQRIRHRLHPGGGGET
jgi:hypothetical protein